jgi:hypothetical protein
MKNHSGKNQSVYFDHTQADITFKDGTRPHIMVGIDEMTHCILRLRRSQKCGREVDGEIT